MDWPWFSFEVRSTAPPEPWGVLADLLVSTLDDPPFWTIGSEPKVHLGVRSTARSKVRVREVAHPSPQTVRAALARRRSGRVTGGGVMFVRQDPPAAWVDVDLGSSCVGTFRSEGPGALFNDERFGQTALRVARALVEVAGSVRWGCGWFGWYPAPPLATGVGLLPEPGQTLGYSYLLCMPPRVIEALGGAEAVRRGPASDVCDVTTATGERCLLALLRRSPAGVTDEVLRDWKAFLSPVTAADALTRRREAFDRMALTASSPWLALPAMVLQEDWPIPPSSSPN